MGSRTHVVILNWNGRRYVRDCLDSIFAQTYRDAKILVVDNGSTDGSAEFIRDEFPEAVRRRRDRGWNQGDERQIHPQADGVAAAGGARLQPRTPFRPLGLFQPDFGPFLQGLDLAWRARLAGWETRFAPRAVVYHKYSASSSYQSAWKTYQGERNRIWNLVQNYPMQYVAEGIPWNGMRVLAALRRRILPGRDTSPPTTGAGRGPSFAEFASATVRARLDAYAGLRMAFQKRRMRRAYRHVDNRTIGRWLRHYGVPIKSMPVN